MVKKKGAGGNGQGGGRDRVRTLLKALPDRRYDEELLDALQRCLDAADDVGADLAWLAAYDLDPGVSENAVLVLYMALESEDVPEEVQDELREAALPVIRSAVRSPKVPEGRKLRLGTLLDACGEDPMEDEAFAQLAALPGGRERMVKEAARQVSASPQALAGLLGILGEDDEALEEPAFAFLAAIAQEAGSGEPEGAALLLGTLAAVAGERDLTEIAQRLVKKLGGLGTDQALWCLEELGRWPGLNELSEQARAAAQKLADSGLTPGLAIPREYSHGLVSNVDGAGSRTVNLFFRTPEGTMDVVTVMGHERRGMTDTWCAYDDAAELEEEIRDMAAGTEIALAPCSVAFARSVVADLWAMHQEEGRPFPGVFFLHRVYFGEAQIELQRRLPDLAPYRLDTLEPSRSLFDGDVEEILDSPAYSSSRFASDAAYEFVSQHAPPRAGNLSKQKRDLFARTIALKEKDALLDRMAVNLEVEALAGRAHFPANRLAARTWLGLKNDVMSFHKVPFIQELCAVSTEAILGNIRAGFSNQDEVNQALLDASADMWFDDEDDSEDDLFF